MSILAISTMSNHWASVLLAAAIVIGLTVRVLLLRSQKCRIFPDR